jgi:cob(I)alamin adenosyltransferase
MLEQGLVQVYTTKTGHMNFAHVGLSLRATGQYLRTFVMGFLPHPFVDIEDRALSLLKPHVVVERLPIKSILPEEDLFRRDIEQINRFFERAQEIVSGSAFDIIILEEINTIVDRGILPVSSMLQLMKNKPATVELILTGNNANREIVEQADLVTEMAVHKNEQGPGKTTGTDQEGAVSVITGNGKGKTTYCLGRAMFSAASGIPSKVIQFIKSPHPYGEVVAAERLPNLEIKSKGAGFVLETSEPPKKHRDAAKKAWEASLGEIFSHRYGLLVLDEINVATHLGLIRPHQVSEMLRLKPRDLHIILSGRNAHPVVMEHASVAFEMNEIKHPFHKGIKARRGIEF